MGETERGEATERQVSPLNHRLWTIFTPHGEGGLRAQGFGAVREGLCWGTAAGGPTWGHRKGLGNLARLVLPTLGSPGRFQQRRSGHAQKPDQDRRSTGQPGPQKEQVVSVSPSALAMLTSGSSQSCKSLAASGKQWPR